MYWQDKCRFPRITLRIGQTLVLKEWGTLQHCQRSAIHGSKPSGSQTDASYSFWDYLYRIRCKQPASSKTIIHNIPEEWDLWSTGTCHQGNALWSSNICTWPKACIFWPTWSCIGQTESSGGQLKCRSKFDGGWLDFSILSDRTCGMCGIRTADCANWQLRLWLAALFCYGQKRS